LSCGRPIIPRVNGSRICYSGLMNSLSGIEGES
jgi:hypothetical protein